MQERPEMPDSVPDWERAIGGDDVNPWMEDIARKNLLFASDLAYIRQCAASLRSVAHEGLDWKGVLPGSIDVKSVQYPLHMVFAHPSVLRTTPNYVDWYVGLAGIAQKTMGNLGSAYAASGGGVKPSTVLKNLQNGRCPEDKELQTFCVWLNSRIAAGFFYPSADGCDLEIKVGLLLGGRAIGRGQNISGCQPIYTLCRFILDDPTLSSRVERVQIGQTWSRYDEQLRPEAMLKMMGIAFKDRQSILFHTGGGVPDIEVLDPRGIRIMVGEIKARKDLSNAWESWMPQLGDHLRTWRTEFPGARRYVLGTVIVSNMLTGIAGVGGQRVGLHQLHEEGLLDNLYNITNLTNDPQYRSAFIRDITGLLQR